MFSKVKDRPDLVFDPNSGAILNIDQEGKEEYLRKRDVIMRAKANEAEINNIKEQVSSMSSDISEIKDLLQRILSK